MKSHDYPNLLIVSKLIQPIETSINSIKNAQSELKEDMSKVLLKGVFVLTVSSLEIMLTDVLQYYLVNFPLTVTNKNEKYSSGFIIPGFFSEVQQM